MDNLNYKNFPYIYEQYLGGNFEVLMRGIAEIKTKHLKMALDSAKDDVFNLATAKGNALDLWGRLLNISRFIPAQFDFDGASDYPVNDYQTLSDDDFRTIIIWAFQTQNIDITIEEVTRWLNGYFNMNASVQDKNSANVTDFQDMSEKVFYSDKIPDFARWVLTEYDLIPRPAGVLDSLIPIVSKIFGFRVTDDPNFLEYRTNFFFGRFVNENDTPPTPPILPYERVAYLRTGLNTGNNPFIDTGLTLNSEYEFQVKGFITEGNIGTFINAYSDNNNRTGQIFYNASNKRVGYYWRINSTGQGLATLDLNSSAINMAQEFELIQNKNGLTLKQGSVTETINYTGASDKTGSARITLFRNDNSGSWAGNMETAINEAKILLNGEVIRHFIAVKRLSDNKYCFYDLIEGRFYENANSAGINFIAP